MSFYITDIIFPYMSFNVNIVILTKLLIIIDTVLAFKRNTQCIIHVWVCVCVCLLLIKVNLKLLIVRRIFVIYFLRLTFIKLALLFPGLSFTPCIQKIFYYSRQ